MKNDRIDNHYDLIVIGGGSGGAGAAITAGRLGARTLWVEKERVLGGTGVNALVNIWQPSYTTSVLAEEIARRLIDRGGGAFLTPASDTPSGRPLYRIARDIAYAQTLRRWDDYPRKQLAPAVVYTPAAMDAVLRELAAESGQVTVATQTLFLDAQSSGGRITGITVQTPDGIAMFTADAFIDAGADIPLAISAGCAWRLGREAAAEYGEPSAPPEPVYQLNGCTLCFIIEHGPDRIPLDAEPYGNDSDWAAICEMPDGRLCVNMVYQLSGEACRAMGAEQARELLLGNIRRRWPGVQRAYGLQEYGIADIAPRIGVRESPRLHARYVLTEHDFDRGNFGAHHPDCIAFTDHALDLHAPGGGCTEAQHGPMGIPFRCLQPREIDNLLVTCRGAGFSSLAASAARLQRTMIELGEAAASYYATGKVPVPARPAYVPWQG